MHYEKTRIQIRKLNGTRKRDKWNRISWEDTARDRDGREKGRQKENVCRRKMKRDKYTTCIHIHIIEQICKDLKASNEQISALKRSEDCERTDINTGKIWKLTDIKILKNLNAANERTSTLERSVSCQRTDSERISWIIIRSLDWWCAWHRMSISIQISKPRSIHPCCSCPVYLSLWPGEPRTCFRAILLDGKLWIAVHWTKTSPLSIRLIKPSDASLKLLQHTGAPHLEQSGAFKDVKCVALLSVLHFSLGSPWDRDG